MSTMSKASRNVPATLAVALIWAFGAAPATEATIIANPGCVEDIGGSANCTANDVTFVLVGLGVQEDGCVNGDPAETVSIFLGATLQNTTANTRYDIGMYVATDGDPNGDGALTGACARQHLTPVAAAGVTTCGVGALDLDGPASGVDNNTVGVADGPYLTAESGSSNSLPDSCGDLFTQNRAGCDEDGDGNWDDTILQFPTAVPLPCRDVDNDGFVNIPTCATWGQQANEVDLNGNDLCDSEAEVVHGTPAKCNCEDSNSTIPRPNLALSCGCTPTDLQPGESAVCTVTYTNASTCIPDLTAPERFRCGTAGFVRFSVDYNEANGSVSGIAAAGTGGGGATSDNGSRILWTPSSASSTPGIIGPNNTATLTYTYTVAANPPSTTVTNVTTALWSDNSSFSPEVAQAALTCGVTLTTPVTLASASADWEDGRAVVEWSTATEAGNAGFNLYTEIGGDWVRLNRRLIPSTAVDSTEIQRYRYVVDGTVGRRFVIEDVAVNGEPRRHPPLDLGSRSGREPAVEPIAWAPIRQERDAAAADARRAGMADVGAADGSLSVAAAARGNPRPAAELRVSADGLYRVTYEDLLAGGVDFDGVQAKHLALARDGQAVAMATSPGRFGPGSYFEFHGRGLDTLYTDTSVYTLSVDNRAAVRMTPVGTVASGSPAAFYLETVEVERERGYSFGTVTEDPWYDTQFFGRGSTIARTFAFTVEDYLAGAAPAVLSVDFWGSTEWPASPDHHLDFALNGVALGDTFFDGRTPHSVSIPLPAGSLVEGANQLTVRLIADLGINFDIVYLDGFRVEYPRAFVARDGALRFTAAGPSFRVTGLPSSDVIAVRTSAAGTELLTGAEVVADGTGFAVTVPGAGSVAEYLVTTVASMPAATVAPARQPADITGGLAEYLVIAHPLFLGSLDRLVNLHESEGLAVRVVDVEDVYAQFGGGVFDAAAIDEYIAWAAAEMGTRYVLLVGGDTYDYRGYGSTGSASFLPSLYARTGDLISFAPADSLYADVDDDGVPDLAIGRLPVRTVAELDVLIDKTLDYAGKSYVRTSVLAADAFSGVSFSNTSERFQDAIGSGWEVIRAYIDWSGVAGARSLLIEAIENGAALTVYSGHSGPTRWTYAGLFNSADATRLTNEGLPTVVVQFGCWNTYHVQPSYNTLGQTLMISGDRGAAAVMGSSTLLETTSSDLFANYLSPLIAQPGTRLGDAVLQAKQQFSYQHRHLADVLLGWTLLGDPALVVDP